MVNIVQGKVIVKGISIGLSSVQDFGLINYLGQNLYCSRVGQRITLWLIIYDRFFVKGISLETSN